MTIYSQVGSNKFKSYLIFFLFILFISSFFYVLGKVYGNSNGYFIIGLIFSTLTSIGSYFYSDQIVLFMSGAKPADKKKYFNFYTAVENMSIAAGIPMPKVYIMEDPAPNAFATGRDPKHAVIAATTGLLEKLERKELEGVVAHEISHIKNYDILFMTVVSVLVGILVFVTDWVSRSWFFGRSDDDSDKKNSGIFLVIFIVMLILNPLIATLIQMAISRKREYLADADGALLTRNPEGLALALEKISDYKQPLKTATNATAHMFISNPFGKRAKTQNWLNSLFSTHPPIEERIRILRAM